MSYMMFRQQCNDCKEAWNAAFGIIGMTQIASPPTECPHCGSVNFEKIADHWVLENGSRYPAMIEKSTIQKNIEDVITTLPTTMSKSQLILWFHSANGWLDAGKPIDLVEHNAELVLDAAKHEHEMWMG